MEKTKV